MGITIAVQVSPYAIGSCPGSRQDSRICTCHTRVCVFQSIDQACSLLTSLLFTSAERRLEHKQSAKPKFRHSNFFTDKRRPVLLVASDSQLAANIQNVAWNVKSALQSQHSDAENGSKD